MSTFGTIPIDGRHLPGLSPAQSEEVTAAATQVRRRTGCHGWYNPRRQCVVWVRGADPMRGGPGSERVMQRGRYLPVDVARTCRTLAFSRMSAREQRRDIQAAKQRQEDKRVAEARAAAVDVAPELASRFKHLNRLMTMGRHSRPLVLTP